ncbi:uncharacterized protein [Nicotiana tomentosiformis]|uniref:uncharacterized protein n=1 Tax=Nicotiana tomentosiformis TaxID=4098 RepID=UPI00388C50FD
MPAKEYSVEEQLKKTLAHISIMDLLMSFESHRDALVKVLSGLSMLNNTTSEALAVTIGKMVEANKVLFLKDELPSDGVDHNKALHITFKCGDKVISRVMVIIGSRVTSAYSPHCENWLEIASMKIHFTFCMRKSSNTLTSVAYRDMSCPWKLHALKYESSNRFYITKYHGWHTCGVQHISRCHPNATSKTLGAYYQERYVNGKGSSPSDPNDANFADFYQNLTYWRSWKGFAHMRKVSAVDRIFRSGRYGGCLLSTAAQDTDNHVFPIALCVLDKECDDSWTYFFEQLWHIVDDSDELYIISDRHLFIGNDFKNVFTAAHHGFCTRHIAKNMCKRFHCGIFIKHFFSATHLYNTEEFFDHFQQLRDKSREVANCLANEIGFQNWTKTFFPENRYVVLTTNIAESLNVMLKDQRDMPIIGLFNHIV